jgi:hypothetical protein
MVGVENLEADRRHALPQRVGYTEEPGGIVLTAFDSGNVSQRLKNLWDQDFTAEGCGNAERFASVAFGVFQRASCDPDARTGCQRRRQIDAGSFKDGSSVTDWLRSDHTLQGGEPPDHYRFSSAE